MTVMVTGAAGFIGSNLIESLVDDGQEVVAVDNFDVGQSRDVLSHDSVELLERDIRSLTSRDMKRVDEVYHLAALANPRTCADDYGSAFSVNVEGTFNVLQTSEICDVDRVLLMSSAAVYGDDSEIPIQEDDSLAGDSEYASTKRMCETMGETFNENRDLETVVVRPFNTYGPGQNQDYLIPTLVTQAIDEGKIEVWTTEPTKDFVYIDDTISALRSVMETEGTAGETFNIGTGESYSVDKVADMMVGFFEEDIDVIDLDKEVDTVSHLEADIKKLKSYTGWGVEHSIQDGLRRTVEYYRNERS